ncbi:MAG: type II toxin-antitoxin system RelE/ParE family toxin [Rhodospirillales bacterium]|nr:type II toxin-antitoxin system RelE/ParE family toxin [Rhodospirillales bacterium]
MPDFVVAPAARQDLIDIWNFVADSDPAATGRLIDRFDKAFARLATAQELGTSDPV